ncbi:MAG: Arm DNA-binding domain-containing protein [Acidobacteriaceae bacterium]
MALTDTGVRKAKAKDTAYRLSDGGGLYLWITPAGGKLWRWKYRHECKEKLMSFGKYPDVPLSQARERHAEARSTTPPRIRAQPSSCRTGSPPLCIRARLQSCRTEQPTRGFNPWNVAPPGPWDVASRPRTRTRSVRF